MNYNTSESTKISVVVILKRASAVLLNIKCALLDYGSGRSHYQYTNERSF